MGIFLLVCFVCDLLKKPEVLPVEGGLAVTFIDVGQGDCTLVTAEDMTMLIDCGEASETGRVEEYLRGCGINYIDIVVGTHPHSDHMGGMAELLRGFEVGQVIIPHLADEDVPITAFFSDFLEAVQEREIPLKEAESGSTFALGDARCRIIAPNSSSYADLNNYSVGILMQHGANTFVFTGDAEGVSEREMAQTGMLSHASVYKAGHHGSDSSSSEGFLSILSPDNAVISCGEGNPYGHPKDITLQRLAEHTDNIYRTDLCGTIVFLSDGEELTVRTERSAA
ncbi:MAG: MBL fold metallo-hydrolase [Ruminococcus sp.]|nr:MBL fold metallo-hydrolase [Ruminococcus sp.]